MGKNILAGHTNGPQNKVKKQKAKGFSCNRKGIRDAQNLEVKMYIQDKPPKLFDAGLKLHLSRKLVKRIEPALTYSTK